MALREVPTAELTIPPYSAVGLIFVHWPDGATTQGSVAVIGRNDIVTATHVIHDPAHGGMPLNFDLYFGVDYNNVTDRFDSSVYSWAMQAGTFEWQLLAFPSNVYSDANPGVSFSESQFDTAVIGVSVPVGNATNWFPIDPGRDTTQAAVAAGYPDNGTGMMEDTLTVSRNGTYGVYTANESLLGGGSSGGPLFGTDRSLIGVKSGVGEGLSSWADIGVVNAQVQAFMAADDWMASIASAPPQQRQAAGDIVYVFRSERTGAGITPASFSYFYTASAAEAFTIRSHTDWPWLERVPSFEAAHSRPDLSLPVYRFWSDTQQSHFFTASAAERDQVIAFSSSHQNGYDWRYEGEGFRVYANGAPTDAAGRAAIPVYRAWIPDKDFDPSNGAAGGHFYTANLAEYQATVQLTGVVGEGVAFYGEYPGV